MYLEYDKNILNYLKEKDKILGQEIDRLGFQTRKINTDLFSSLISAIIGQQISTKAADTVEKRMKDYLDEITPNNILNAGIDEIQKLGITYRKASYIIDIADKVNNKEIDLDNLKSLSDDDVIKELVKLKGIGKWTAEMILIHSLERLNILSYDDLIIQRGIKTLYHHRKITPKLFEKYKKRYSPYGTIASIYLWKIGHGE